MRVMFAKVVIKGKSAANEVKKQLFKRKICQKELQKKTDHRQCQHKNTDRKTSKMPVSFQAPQSRGKNKTSQRLI
ncbi:hypothetical protein [Ligilactobacillus ruminis]|uniref:hypothetical protein n=2 Tax=Ligilactobacillus ruminis TaxID=1623 RepID=UPI001F035BCB|nr:hypothetical protein [Ligilactobacillus ruminis]MDB7637102.1 hypothetical protein [Ligilactobacillus ruminis]MDB7680274.1 hypothetical protein [Ligilactobacillus ruminis]